MEEEKDKSEPATPFKLEEARRRGQVARSIDFVSVIVIAALVVGIYAWSANLVRDGARIGSVLFDQAHQLLFSELAAQSWLSALLVHSLIMMAPFFALAAIAAVFANLIQAGVTFTAFPLKPDLQRINPVNGLKRLFSLRTLYDGAKTVLKLAVLGVVAFMTIEALLAELLRTQQADPKGYLPMLLQQIGSLLFILVLVLAAIGLLDLAYNRWDYKKRMMMSHREIKEEIKRREGDPAVRARLRELQQEAVKRAKSLKRVPEADVLITNPQHYAIALRYDRRNMQAPHITAKGAGDLAIGMKQQARANGVPVVENKSLARRLFTMSAIDEPVASEFYESLARVYAQVFSRRDAQLALEIRS